MISPNTSRAHNGPYELVVYDLRIPGSTERLHRIPGSTERLHRERWAAGEHGDIEALDENHYVLIVRPGGALEVAA